jgi:hypothetical protein
MFVDITIFDLMKPVLVLTSPFLLLGGLFVLLLSQNAYTKFETVLGKEMGLKKRFFPAIESNIYTFHEWLMKRKTAIGSLCVLCAVTFFLVNK